MKKKCYLAILAAALASALGYFFYTSRRGYLNGTWICADVGETCNSHYVFRGNKYKHVTFIDRKVIYEHGTFSIKRDHIIFISHDSKLLDYHFARIEDDIMIGWSYYYRH